MIALAQVLLVFFGLLVGAYGIAVLERLTALGPRRIVAALVLPVSETAALLRQEDLAPRGADRLLFRSAPLIVLAVVALVGLVVPVGPGLVGFDPSIGLFYFIVVLSPFVIAMMNAGWSQNSKEGLFGTFRAAAHLISYEVPLGFAAIGPVMAAESLSTMRIVEAQSGLWYAVWQPLGLAIYLLAALFMTFRHPFAIPQAGTELEGGVLSEYTGPRLLLFKISLDAVFLLLMAMGVDIFFGGWQGPFLAGPVWFVLKTGILAGLVLWAARFAPRLRQDQMLALAWKVLLPASLLNVALVGILALLIPGGGQ
ncbi:MAG: NADH-quinone oxidoreductase subunit H [Chloroflexi bacterium]|nr:NADH-quinone oxidoreductase subunit H [Chloroflexota bacterium]